MSSLLDAAVPYLVQRAQAAHGNDEDACGEYDERLDVVVLEGRPLALSNQSSTRTQTFTMVDREAADSDANPQSVSAFSWASPEQVAALRTQTVTEIRGESADADASPFAVDAELRGSSSTTVRPQFTRLRTQTLTKVGAEQPDREEAPGEEVEVGEYRRWHESRSLSPIRYDEGRDITVASDGSPVALAGFGGFGTQTLTRASGEAADSD